jgi:hypothetical protein
MDRFGISNLLPRVMGRSRSLDRASQLRRIRVTAGFREGENVFKNNEIVELRDVTETELVLHDVRR